MKYYESIEDTLTEKIMEAPYEEIEEFLGYSLENDVMEHLEECIRDVLDHMSESEMLRCEQKYLSKTK